MCEVAAATGEEDVGKEVDVGGVCDEDVLVAAVAAAHVVRMATTGTAVLTSDALMKSTSRPLPHHVARSLQSLKLWSVPGILG